MDPNASTPQGTGHVQISSVTDGWQTSQIYRGRPPGPYVPGGSFRTWLKLFTNFLTLQRITEDNSKKLILLQEIGQSNYELLELLLKGKEPEDASYAEVCETFENHFQQQKMYMTKRNALYGLQQKKLQPLVEFYAEVQEAADTCAFEKDVRDEQVTMVFVGGLSSLETRKFLLEKEHLSSKEALKLAETYDKVGHIAPAIKKGSKPEGFSQQPMHRAPRQRGKRDGTRAIHKVTQNQTDNQKFYRITTPKHAARATILCTNCNQQCHGTSTCKNKVPIKVNKAINENNSATNINGAELAHNLTFEDPSNEKIRKDNKFVNEKIRKDNIFVNEKIRKDNKFVNEKIRMDNKLPPPLYEVDVVVAKKLPPPLYEVDVVVAKKLPPPLHEVDVVVAKKLPPPLHEVDVVVARKLLASLPESDAVVANKNIPFKENTRSNGVEAINSIRTEQPVMLEESFNNVPISMELDTGASLSIINREAWGKLGKPTLHGAKFKAAACNNTELNFAGMFRAEVQFQHVRAKVDIHVLLTMNRSLCGH